MRNAKWLNAEHTRIDLEIDHPKHGWIPFCAVDGDPTTQAVFNATAGGAAGQIAEYVAPVETDEQADAKVQRQIESMERKGMIPRVLREVLLDLPGAQGKGWYAKIKKLDDDVAALKASKRVK